MRAEQIKEHLGNVLEQVIKLLPADHQQRAASKLYVAGGAIVNLTLDVPVVDYDVFCDDGETAQLFKAAGALHDLDIGYEVLARTENAVTWRLSGGEIVQVVTRFTGPPSRVFDSFDFTHCKCYYRPCHWLFAVQEFAPAELVYDPELIQQKLLRYDGNKDEFCLNTLKRMAKFVSRGWTPDNESILALYENIQKSPPISCPVERKKQSIGFYGSSFK